MIKTNSTAENPTMQNEQFPSIEDNRTLAKFFQAQELVKETKREYARYRRVVIAIDVLRAETEGTFHSETVEKLASFEVKVTKDLIRAIAKAGNLPG